jgi:signal transduction histidine kinase
MFSGFIALILGAINDMLLANSIIAFTPYYIFSFSVIFLIMMQVIILIYRWVYSFMEEKRLLREVEFVNQNLEKIVIERTTELTNQKGEVESKKDEIEDKNKELENTIAVKNRIFSIIAHDLKAPIINLLLMIDHLKKNDNKESFNKITSSLTQQASFASNLIDNLLLWGEGQQNKIKYNPGLNNLTDIILENFNLLKETAERKNIRVSYSHKGDPYAICDKDLVSLIIRNLLSNSIKFTNNKGNISVNVEEPSISDGMIYIKIRDNGTGIPKDKLKRLKEGELIDSSPGTNKEKGTGLGLQLCYDLVKINKGEINIESKIGEGTSITVMLPSTVKKGKSIII